MVFGLFRRKVGGIIGNLELEEFYYTLSEEEKDHIREALGSPYQLTTGKPYEARDLDKGTRSYHGGKWSFLYTYGNASTIDDLRERMFLLSLNYAGNAWDMHFSKQALAEHYYKTKNFEKCERYCLEDIDSVVDFLGTVEYLKGAQIKTFWRLAVLYEKQGRYDDAIEISERALEIGQHDGTKSGYEGRISRLRKKLNA